jgi:hypothetical protein
LRPRPVVVIWAAWLLARMMSWSLRLQPRHDRRQLLDCFARADIPGPQSQLFEQLRPLHDCLSRLFPIDNKGWA